MKISHRKCRNRQRNVLVSLRDREICKTKGYYHRRELGNFVDDCTAVSSFTNKPILSGEHLRSTFMIVFSHDGTLLASSHGNHKIKICRLSSLECIQTLRGHPRSVWCLNFHPSSNELLASGCLGGQVRVWDLQGRSEVWNSEKGTTITSLSFHPYERLLAIATGNEILLWDWSRKAPLASVATATSEEYIRLIRFDHHGHHLLTGITNPNRNREGFVYGRRNFPDPLQGDIDVEIDDVPTEPDTIPEPSLADSPPPDSSSSSTTRQGQEQIDSDSSSAADDAATGVHPNTARHLVPSYEDANPPAAENATSTTALGEQQTLVSFETNAQQEGNETVTPICESASSLSGMQNAISSLSSNARGDDGNLDQTANGRDDPMETDNRESLPSVNTSEVSSLTSLSSQARPTGNGFLTSSHQGVSSQRTPNRVVRVRRSYEGPELVQVRVISERFEGVGDQPPRISAEDLSNAVIIRTEETFHVPDLPDSQRTDEPQAARAILFDSSRPVTSSQEPRAAPPQSDDTSPFTGLPLGSSLLDHVPNRNERVEHQVSYPVSASDGMVGHVTITRSTPADSSLLHALQLQRNSGTMGGTVNRRTQGARRVLPSQLHSAAGGRRGLRGPQGVRDDEGGTSEGSRRSRLSRFGFARTAIRRRSGHRRHAAEDDAPTFPQGEYRSLINQALADAFRGRWSNPAVANNINTVTHRLQWWKFKDELPDISNARANVLVPCCKLYSDASCDISPDEKFVVTFIPYTFPDQFVVAAYSLEECNFGKILFSKKFGADAITLSISPSSDNLLVGVAAGQYRCPAMAPPMAMICSLVDQPSPQGGSIKTLQVINHPMEEQGRQATGLNIAKWVPNIGAGFVYGTDKGDLRLCTPRHDISRFKPSRGIAPSSRCLGRSGRDRFTFRSGIHRQRGQSTQTRRRTHSAGTQTDLTSRFVRRRLNPASPGSSVVGSHLAINMSDMFNSPNPHDGSTASPSDDAHTSVIIDQSEQPRPSTSDHSDVIGLDSPSTEPRLSTVASPVHGATASTSNCDKSVISSNPPEPVHPTSATSCIIGNGDTATEPNSSISSHGPPNANNGSARFNSVLYPSSTELSVHPISSLSRNQHSDHVVSEITEAEHNSSDSQRMLSSPVPNKQEITHNVNESMQSNSTDCFSSTSTISSSVDVSTSISQVVGDRGDTGAASGIRTRPQPSDGTSGIITTGQSVFESSQVGLNGVRVTNDYSLSSSATTVTSSDSSVMVSHSSDMQTASDSSYQTE